MLRSVEKFPQQIPTCTLRFRTAAARLPPDITREMTLETLARDLLGSSRSARPRRASDTSDHALCKLMDALRTPYGRPMHAMCRTQRATRARGAETSASLRGHAGCRTKERRNKRCRLTRSVKPLVSTVVKRRRSKGDGPSSGTTSSLECSGDTRTFDVFRGGN